MKSIDYRHLHQVDRVLFGADGRKYLVAHIESHLHHLHLLRREGAWRRRAHPRGSVGSRGYSLAEDRKETGQAISRKPPGQMLTLRPRHYPARRLTPLVSSPQIRRFHAVCARRLRHWVLPAPAQGAPGPSARGSPLGARSIRPALQLFRVLPIEPGAAACRAKRWHDQSATDGALDGRHAHV